MAPKKLTFLALQWYILGGIVLTIVFTTCIRSSAMLSRYQQNMDEDFRMLPMLQGPSGRRLNVQSLRVNDKNHLVHENDYIYRKDDDQWDSSPIVIEKYKLIFFTVPKVACTSFKLLFRKMMGAPDWKSQDENLGLPHNMHNNGLRYLFDFPVKDATRMMTDPTWTRAIFLRDPKERFLDVFLDKALGDAGDFLASKCCPATRKCADSAQIPVGFLELAEQCSDSHWDPQYHRMEPKYWDYINFVGRSESMYEDTKRLLTRVGAWEQHAQRGWGPDGKAEMFEMLKGNDKPPNSRFDYLQYYTPAIERKIERFYAMDYVLPLFNFTVSDFTKDLFVTGEDSIYQRGEWDGSPIVVEKYKLVFFTIPKAGCGIWKQAFRRMEGLPNWTEVGGPHILPHNPSQNGLKYLYDFDAETASEMMQSSEWTRAVFLRNPKDRFLSAYWQMVTEPHHVQNTCCPTKPGCEKALKTMPRFIELMKTCRSAHWAPQSERMEDKFWKQINFVGSLDNAEEDSRKLLQQIGAWEEIGSSGWGSTGNDPIFTKTGKELDRVRTALAHYTSSVDRLLDTVYEADYNHELFHFPHRPSTLLATSGTNN